MSEICFTFTGTTSEVFLDSSVANHLGALVKCTNAHINRINAAATNQSQTMEELSETFASSLEYAFNTTIVLQDQVTKG